MKTEPIKNRRKTLPPWTGRFFGLDDELYDKITEAATSLGVSKARVINDSLRLGMPKAIEEIKYG